MQQADDTLNTLSKNSFKPRNNCGTSVRSQVTTVNPRIDLKRSAISQRSLGAGELPRDRPYEGVGIRRPAQPPAEGQYLVANCRSVSSLDCGSGFLHDADRST
jgi:hypothetical protein